RRGKSSPVGAREQHALEPFVLGLRERAALAEVGDALEARDQRRRRGRHVHAPLAELDPLAQAAERLVVGVDAPLRDRHAVRQLVDVAVGGARLTVALALTTLEAR